MNGNGKKIIALAAVAVVMGLIVGAAFNVQHAQANGFTDFLGKIFVSFEPKPSANVQASQPASLYQPVNDYENAVVSAVKASSPAVVSIIISEKVPVVTNCPYNPFQDLPPEFQQFFGNGGDSNMTQPCDTGKTQLQEVGGGSGFIVSSDGLILTNKHVVSDASASYTVITNDGTKYSAKVLARDANQDLAVVKIDAAGLPTVTLGDSSSLQLGQTAIAIGNARRVFEYRLRGRRFGARGQSRRRRRTAVRRRPSRASFRPTLPSTPAIPEAPQSSRRGHRHQHGDRL